MPCYDSRNEPDNVRAEAKKEFKADLDKLTRMLCLACSILQGEYGSLDGCGDHELIRWWKEHQRLDSRRRRRRL